MAETSEELMRRFLRYSSARDAAAMVCCFAERDVYDNLPDNR